MVTNLFDDPIKLIPENNSVEHRVKMSYNELDVLNTAFSFNFFGEGS